VQHITWPIVGLDKQTNIKFAPAHQVGDVTPHDFQWSDVGEDPRLVELVEERAAASSCSADCLAASSSSAAGGVTTGDASSGPLWPESIRTRKRAAVRPPHRCGIIVA
jgi:hypothetical protein